MKYLFVLLLASFQLTCFAQDLKPYYNHYNQLTGNARYSYQQKLDSLIAEFPHPFVQQYADLILLHAGGDLDSAVLQRVLESGANPNGGSQYEVHLFHFPRSPGSTMLPANNGKCKQVRHTNCPDEVFHRQAVYVSLLLKYGAKLDTAISASGQNNVMLVAAGANELRLLRFLVDRNGGKLIGASSAYLDRSSQMGSIDVIKYLVEEKKIDVNSPFYGGNTILGRSADNFELADYLIHKGANVNAVNAAGWTPLMYAVQYGCIPCIELMLNNGADRSAKNGKGEDILDIAKKYSYDPKVVDYVRQHRKG
jgi:hypothetical protein